MAAAEDVPSLTGVWDRNGDNSQPLLTDCFYHGDGSEYGNTPDILDDTWYIKEKRNGRIRMIEVLDKGTEYESVLHYKGYIFDDADLGPELRRIGFKSCGRTARTDGMWIVGNFEAVVDTDGKVLITGEELLAGSHFKVEPFVEACTDSMKRSLDREIPEHYMQMLSQPCAATLPDELDQDN